MSTEPSARRPRALLLAPELPGLGKGGGPLRTESVLQFLGQRYNVEVLTLDLAHHSKSLPAKVWRNAARLILGSPPLFDRYSGYEDQLSQRLNPKGYDVAVIEHFWCASYAPSLRPYCSRLVLDLHNIESELAATDARSRRGPAAWASARFAAMYRRLEKKWLPKFDILLVTSEDDRGRVLKLSPHKNVRVFANALPLLEVPTGIVERNAVVFSGNLEYHPNVEAVEWFRNEIWPLVRDQSKDLTWELVGRNPEAIAGLLQDDSRITIIGPVDDAISALASAKVSIVPLRSGSGTRFKILEAWAARRAVVSTSLGAEGLGAVDGQHLLIADDARSFTAAIIKLLNDSALRERLGSSGRALYEKRFTWPEMWRTFDEAGPL